MAKWFGKVGYGHSVEPTTQNGVWEDEMTERAYYGDVIRNTRRFVGGDQINSDLTTTMQIEMVTDPYALENIFAIRYVEWAGTLWTVANVDERRPRLILSLGVRYNGPRPSAEPDSTNPVSTTSTTESTRDDIGW